MAAPMGDGIYTISAVEYRQMQRKIKFLRALERAGVDNWEGYDIAKDFYEEDLTEQEKEELEEEKCKKIRKLMTGM